MKKGILILVISLVFLSCTQTKKETAIEKSEIKIEKIAANYKSIEVDIEGMTCEIGCARTIQSKLSKVKGITYSKVDFESKKGTFTFDTNKISQEDITKKINGIAGGDLYSATKTIDLKEIIN